ncbi:restriction endonuclease subunit S [Rhizobium leguminosarum bv. viciae]|uniref:restriction endonuclease subunit S n=1 Tax=Rhizobium leguminosarum TaxID=384 RepID=UPI0010397A95|nr:restriction endonuclease subunit S [Rhizobium leguminosarum]TBY75801.1 restriction endonuclease subunit S [Rhizobium leguminosarum bv. viciae]
MSVQKLGELIEIKHGFAFSGEHFCSDGPFVLLTPGNFYEAGGFKFREDQKHYDGPVPSDFILNEGDLLVAMTEQGEGLLGSAAFVPSGKQCLHNQRLGLVSPKTGVEVDLRYVYYLLNSRNVRQQIRATASGAKVRHTSPTRIYAVTTPKYSLAAQRRIASILGAYDDLIDVNRRRIVVLEQMARGVFEEWFVRFRFPGHKEVPVRDTPDGPLPAGWHLGPFTEIAEVLSGGTPKKEKPEYWGGGIPFFTPRDAPTTAWVFDTLANVTDAGVKNCNSKLYAKDTVFITARGTVGKVALAAEPMAMNQSCYALLGKGFPQFFLFSFTQFASERLQAMSNGAVFDTIIIDTFRKLLLPIPPIMLSRQYEEKITPLIELSRVVTASNKNLAAARDLLLPRLISGQLSVAEAERELEEAA